MIPPKVFEIFEILYEEREREWRDFFDGFFRDECVSCTLDTISQCHTFFTSKHVREYSREPWVCKSLVAVPQ